MGEKKRPRIRDTISIMLGYLIGWLLAAYMCWHITRGLDKMREKYVETSHEKSDSPSCGKAVKTKRWETTDCDGECFSCSVMEECPYGPDIGSEE